MGAGSETIFSRSLLPSTEFIQSPFEIQTIIFILSFLLIFRVDKSVKLFSFSSPLFLVVRICASYAIVRSRYTTIDYVTLVIFAAPSESIITPIR